MILSIEYTELLSLLEKPEAVVLIDVRTEEEHAHYNIGGVNIPMDDWQDIIKTYDTACPLILYCAKGIRSWIVLEKLLAKGYHKLYNLSGGISSLQIAGMK